VTRIDSDTAMVISSPFRPAPAGATYERLGHADEVGRGYTFVARPHATADRGDSIMELAGDLGAILCMGATSHMLDGTEASIADFTGMTLQGGGAIPQPTLARVTRTFRNWSLDRRLVDEWREVVTGGALAPHGADAAETLLMREGWIPAMRKWLRVVDDTAASAADGGARSAGANEPTNLELSQAIAKLFDMPTPAAVVPAGVGP
jgi:hypothetical protein